MINRFQPAYFEYGTEASELLLNDPAGFADFVVFASAVYTNLSSSFPNLKIMTSIALKSPGSAEMNNIVANYGPLMPYTDVLGISVYPYAFYNHTDRGNPAKLPQNWLSQASVIAGNKPMAISETGWIAENLVISNFQYSEQSDQAKQNAYAAKMLQEADNLNMVFVIWWCITDFDTLWNNELGQDPVAKIWKDIGLFDENQNPRSMVQTWDLWLNSRYQP